MATFGNSTSNQASESHAERIMISSAVAPSSGAVQSAVARLWLSSDGDVNDDHTDAFFVIYADDNGAPGQLLAVSDVIEVDTFTAQSEHTFTFSGSNQIDIEEGETYWIGPGWRNVNGVFFGRTSGGERWEYNFNWDQPPADLTGVTPNAMNSGPMYAVVTYEEESGGGPTEVKRLYLSSLPATYRRNASAWVTDDTGTENTRRLTEQPWGPSVEYSRPETASNNEPWVLLGMWVSEPLAEPAIVYPEATLCAGMWESSGSANMYPFAVVSITQGDSTGDLRGSTLSHYNSGREFPTTEQAYRFDLDVVDDGAIQAQAGDRIVIQVGYKPENTSSTSYTGTIAFGGTGSPDLDDEDTDLTRPAWIDITFSEGVQFEEPDVDTRRFYLTSADTPAEVTSTAGIWDDWTDDIYALGDQPEGDSVPVTIAETDPDSGWLGLVGTWVSPPAAADGEILEAPWVSTIAGFESDADANMSHVLAAWIMEPDGSRRVTFVGGVFGGELPVGEANNRGLRLILDPVEAPGAMALPQEIFEGERVVVEYGVMAQNSSSTAYSATFYAGGTGPDLQANDTGSDARRPAWIDIPVSSGLVFEESEDTSTPPATAFDLSRWHLTTPADSGDGDAEQINQPELDSYASEYFFLDAEGRMAMLAPVDGFTTSGESGATRCEFRERDLPGYTPSAWSIYDRAGRSLTVSGYFDPTSIEGGSNPRKEMIIGQIHGDLGSPPIYLAAEYHVATPRIRLFKYNGSNSAGVDNLVVGIEPGDLITYRIEYVPGANPTDPEEPTGRLNIYAVAGDVDDLPETPQYSYAPADFFSQDTNWYFKFGAYNKTQIGAADSGRSEARITFFEITVDDVPVVSTSTRFFLAA